MLKTKLAIAIALVAALSLLLAPAAYAQTGTTTGSFGASPQPPTVDDIEIFSDAGLSNAVSLLNPMSPGSTFYARVTVTSLSKLKNLDFVKVNLFYNISDNVDMPAPADPAGADTQVCAILTCTVNAPNGPPTWAMFPTGAGTTWSILGGPSSYQPGNLNATTGDWVFAFIPGKVAHQADNTTAPGPDTWDAQGKAINKQASEGTKYVRTKGMNCYTEITVHTPGVNWGAVPLGLTFSDEANSRETGIIVNYLANGDYEESIASENWTGTTDNVTLDATGGNPPSAAGMFALMANDTTDNTTSEIVKFAYTAIDSTGAITPEVGDNVTANTLWLSLSTTGIFPETYSGAIYYQISCR
jgi:hypothetical protein